MVDDVEAALARAEKLEAALREVLSYFPHWVPEAYDADCARGEGRRWDAAPTDLHEMINLHLKPMLQVLEAALEVRQ